MQDLRLACFAWEDPHGGYVGSSWMAARPEMPTVPPGPETVTHLCKDYPFSVVVWNHLSAWTREDLPISGFLPETGNVSNWWDELITRESKYGCKHQSGRLIYIIWYI